MGTAAVEPSSRLLNQEKQHGSCSGGASWMQGQGLPAQQGTLGGSGDGPAGLDGALLTVAQWPWLRIL